MRVSGWNLQNLSRLSFEIITEFFCEGLYRNSSNRFYNFLKGENSKPKILHLAKVGATHIIISICQDLSIKVWSSSGDVLFASSFEQIKDENIEFQIKSQLSPQGDALDIFVQETLEINY